MLLRIQLRHVACQCQLKIRFPEDSRYGIIASSFLSVWVQNFSLALLECLIKAFGYAKLAALSLCEVANWVGWGTVS